MAGGHNDLEGRKRKKKERRETGFVSEEDSRQESSHPSRGWPTGRWRPRGVQMTSLRVTETRVGRRSVDYLWDARGDRMGDRLFHP